MSPAAESLLASRRASGLASGASLLRQGFGAEVRCDVVPLEEAPAALLPEERAAVAAAGPVRLREFAAGRACARRLLGELGFAPGPILQASDRSPAWPPGAVGSIAHDRRVCAVAVGRAAELRSLGLDAEPDEPLEEELWSAICTPRELAALSAVARGARRGRQAREAGGRLARLLFSAKECAYKCLHPLTRTALELPDVDVELLPGADRFRAKLLRPAGSFAAGSTLEGFFVGCAGSIVTAISLRAPIPEAGAA